MVEGASKVPVEQVSPTRRFSLSFFSRKSQKSGPTLNSTLSSPSSDSIASSPGTITPPNEKSSSEKKKKWFGKKSKKKTEHTQKSKIRKSRSEGSDVLQSSSKSSAKAGIAEREVVSDSSKIHEKKDKKEGNSIFKSPSKIIKEKEEDKKKDENLGDKKLEENKESNISPSQSFGDQSPTEEGGISKLKRVISKKILTRVPSKGKDPTFEDKEEEKKGKAEKIALPPTPLHNSSGFNSRFSSASNFGTRANPLRASRNLPALISSGNNSTREWKGKERRQRKGIIPNFGSNYTSTSSFDTRRMQENNSEAGSISSYDYVKKRVGQLHIRSPLLAQALEKSLTKEHFNELMSNSQYSEQGSQMDALSQVNEFEEASEEGTEGGMAKMIAIFDFAGERTDDLTIWEGDIVVILAMFEDGWWLGLRVESNQIGRVPSNFLEPIPPGSKVVRALANYSGDDSDDLEIEEGDIILITEKNGNWWFGELDGKSGWLPSNYLEDIDLLVRDQYISNSLN